MILWVRKGLGSSLVLPSRAHTHILSGIFNLTPIYIYLCLWQLSPGIRISSMLEPSLHQRLNIHQWPLGSHNVKPQLLLNNHPSPATFKPLKLVPYGTVYTLPSLSSIFRKNFDSLDHKFSVLFQSKYSPRKLHCKDSSLFWIKLVFVFFFLAPYNQCLVSSKAEVSFYWWTAIFLQ